MQNFATTIHCYEAMYLFLAIKNIVISSWTIAFKHFLKRVRISQKPLIKKDGKINKNDKNGIPQIKYG